MPQLARLVAEFGHNFMTIFSLLQGNTCLRAAVTQRSRRRKVWASPLFVDDAQLVASARADPQLLCDLQRFMGDPLNVADVTDAGVVEAAQLVGSHLTRFALCRAPISDAAVTALATYCVNLVELVLSGAEGLTGQAVRSVAGGLGPLVDLAMDSVQGMGDADLKALGQGCTQLTHLCLGSMSDIGKEGYLALGGLCKLTHVDLYGAVQLRVKHVQQLLPMLPELQRMYVHVEGAVLHRLQGVNWRAVAAGCGCSHVHVLILDADDA